MTARAQGVDWHRRHIRDDFKELAACVWGGEAGRWLEDPPRDLLTDAAGGECPVVYDAGDHGLYAGLYPVDQPLAPRTPRTPWAVWCLELEHDPSPQTLDFFRHVVELFNEDLARAACAGQPGVVWRALIESQFRRAIARHLAFDPEISTEWIKLMENSLALTHEGKPVRYAVAFTRDLEQASPMLAERLVRFNQPMAVGPALMREKWIRAVVDGERVALLGDQVDGGRLLGFVSLSDLAWPEKDQMLYAPHVRWVRLQNALLPEDVAFVASPAGDLFLMQGRGTVFHKTQGHWQYANHQGLQRVVRRRVGEQVAASVLRAAIDLSYERKGALFVILDPDASPAELIRDHERAQRANQDLRLVMSGKHISRGWRTQEVITAAAATDGATILDQSGTVLDIACMIAPSPEAFARRGVREAPVARGARTTAARQASCFGLVIKVSEDGPISVFSQGREISWSG